MLVAGSAHAIASIFFHNALLNWVEYSVCYRLVYRVAFVEHNQVNIKSLLSLSESEKRMLLTDMRYNENICVVCYGVWFSYK